MTMHRSVSLALGALVLAGQAHADVTSDWLAAKDAADFTKTITYAGPPVEAKFGHPAPPASLATPIWQASMDRLNKITNNKFAFKVFGGGTLLGARDGFKAVRGGVAEFATCYVSGEGVRQFGLSKIWEQPFVTPTNPMVATRVAQELAAKYEAPEFTKQGVVWASMAINGTTDIMSKKPIRKLEDLQGLKIIYQGSIPEVAKALGFTQLNIAYPEIYTAMQQGVADAVIWVDAGFVPYKIYEVAKYRTKVGLTAGGISTCYNGDWFAKLAPDMQKAFISIQEPMAQATAQITMLDYSKTAEQVYKDRGVETITLSDDDMKKLHTRLEPIVDAYAAAQEKDGVHAKDMLTEIRTLTAKYSSMSSDDLMRLAIEHPAIVSK